MLAPGWEVSIPLASHMGCRGWALRVCRIEWVTVNGSIAR
jgi:hypothetical protein